MSILLILIILIACLAAIIRPWLGILAYYTLAIGVPQSVWPWIFQDLRVSLYVAISTLAGVTFALLRNKLALLRLRHQQPLLVVVLVVIVNLSHIFSPFGDIPIMITMTADEFMVIFNKAILFYFLAVVLIDSDKKYYCLIVMLGAVSIYFSYWSNMAYLRGEFWRFDMNNRLAGPDGTYSDGNVFAMLFVVGLPVVYYGSQKISSTALRLILLATLPFMVHAILLTGSRGALVGLASVCLYIFVNSKHKTGGLLVVILTVAFVLDQGRSAVERVNETVERSQNIDEGEAVNPRLISWKVGTHIMLDYPLFGVGPQRFILAFPRYDSSRSHVAHNTLIQFGAGSGIIAGLLFLRLFAAQPLMAMLVPSYRTRVRDGPVPEPLSHAVHASALGLLVCSVFLDLMLYEITYLILILLMYVKPPVLVKN